MSRPQFALRNWLLGHALYPLIWRKRRWNVDEIRESGRIRGWIGTGILADHAVIGVFDFMGVYGMPTGSCSPGGLDEVSCRACQRVVKRALLPIGGDR